MIITLSTALFMILLDAVAVFFIILLLKTKKKEDEILKNKFNQIEQAGLMNVLQNDFINGHKEFKNNLIYGERYLFGKKSQIFLKYGEIAKAYQFIYKTNFVESKRTIRVETIDNQKYELCEIALLDKDDPNVKQFYQFVLLKNSNIQILN